MLQAFCSLLVCTLPLTLALLVLIFGLEQANVIVIAEASLVAWAPFFNPVLTLIFVDVYRRQVLRFVHRFRRSFGMSAETTAALYTVNGVTPVVEILEKSGSSK